MKTHSATQSQRGTCCPLMPMPKTLTRDWYLSGVPRWEMSAQGSPLSERIAEEPERRWLHMPLQVVVNLCHVT